MATALYIASALGAVALYMMMPRRGYSPVRMGAGIGAMSLGGLWLFLSEQLPETSGLPGEAWIYQYIFSGLAIASAVRVVTHRKPVYAALWFVMVVLASSGLLLVLGAEFVAFALVIIYAGAILVTYLFVIMLATQSSEPHDESPSAGTMSGEDYDVVSFEPAAAVATGFLLLAVLLSVIFGDTPPKPNTYEAQTDAQIIQTVLTDRPAQRLQRMIATGQTDDKLSPGFVSAGTDSLDNTERVGLDLFRGHPLGLELAGVILLISLVGAVVIARRDVDLTDDPDPDGSAASAI